MILPSSLRCLLVAALAIVGVWLATSSRENDTGLAAGRNRGGVPDLRLSWHPAEDASWGEPSSNLELAADSLRSFVVGVHNAGDGDAAGATIRLHTPLGPHGPVHEIGPLVAEASVRVELELRAAVGMRELCVVGELRPRYPPRRPDPTPDNNRLCRNLVVTTELSNTHLEKPPS